MQQMRSNARNSTMSAQASMNSMIHLVVLWETSDTSVQARGLLCVSHLQRKT